MTLKDEQAAQIAASSYLGSPKQVRMYCSDARAYQIAPIWLSNFLEKDKAFLTRRETL